MSTTIATRPSAGEPAPTRVTSVAWLGAGSELLTADEVASELDDIVVHAVPTPADLGRHVVSADVVHVAGPGFGDPRRRFPRAPIVLEHASAGGAGRAVRGRTVPVAAVVVRSPEELRELALQRPDLAARASVVRPAIDLEAHAPAAGLKKRRDSELKRFRRFHRLAGPTALYAGPYTEEGGLHRAIATVRRLRERLPDLRLAAIPEGPVDQRYLDACEREILDFGHHGIVEWTRSPSDAPLWYALATVVFLPYGSGVASDAAAYAGAAARPVVGTRVPSLNDGVADGKTGCLADGPALDAALESLLGDEERAVRLGEAGRARVELERSPLEVARRLGDVWLSVRR